MGMFDTVRCYYPLTQQPKLNAKLRDVAFQSKDTPAQWLDLFEIRCDGQLWWARCIEGEVGAFHKSTLTGTIVIYGDTGSCHPRDWYEFSLAFVDGQLVPDSIVRLMPDE